MYLLLFETTHTHAYIPTHIHTTNTCTHKHAHINVYVYMCNIKYHKNQFNRISYKLQVIEAIRNCFR